MAAYVRYSSSVLTIHPSHRPVHFQGPPHTRAPIKRLYNIRWTPILHLDQRNILQSSKSSVTAADYDDDDDNDDNCVI
ncbi:hypothetical protein V1477_011718 [Vespula maculifrons]|uniref:Uncharacterized protein n=1 Tax=Vespula maculifrons TaxID=7453 RepID=A0ABD2C0L6_VESMC